MSEDFFDPANIWPAEAKIILAVAKGEWAELSQRPSNPFADIVGEKPVIRAAFLRHLLLGLPLPVGPAATSDPLQTASWFIAPNGIRVVGAKIVGRLDLKDAVCAGGISLCTLALEHCDIPEDVCLDHAYLQRLSLYGSRLRAVSALEATIAGQVDLTCVRPYTTDAHPEQCWLNFDGARVDGDFRCPGAWLVAPPRRNPVPQHHRGRYALSLREADVQGRFFADSLTAIGGISLSFSSFRGEVWLSGATLIASEKNAFSAEGVIIQSNLIVNKADPDRQPFTAKGCTWLLGAKITGNLIARGGQFLNASDDGRSVAIHAQSIEIGGTCSFGNGFKAEGQVKLNEAKISGNFDATGGQFLNRTADGSGLAIRGRNAIIGGTCFLNNGFRAEGQVRLHGVKIAGNLDVSDAYLLNRTDDGKGLAIYAMGAEIGGSCFLRNGLVAQGQILLDGARIGGNFDASNGHFLNRTPDGKALAFSGKSIEIGGYCHFTDGFKAEGEVNLSDAKVTGNLSGRGGHFLNGTQDGVANAIYWHAQMGRHCILDRGFKVEGNISLSGAQITHALVVGLDKEKASVMPVWFLTDAKIGKIDDKMGTGWGGKGTRIILDGLNYDRIDSTATADISKNSRAGRLWFSNPFDPGTDYRHRLKWFRTYIEPHSRFSPQPYEKLAMVFKSTGLMDDARRILRSKRWRYWRTTEPILSKIFTAPFGLFFGFGYSPPLASVTFAAMIILGGLATQYANTHGLMAIDTLPVATVVNDSHTPSLPLAASASTTLVPCGSAINPYLYAADIFIPLVDLHQESLCEPAEVSPPPPFIDLWGIHPNTAEFWLIAKSIYALLGALVTSLLIVTFTGVLQEKANKDPD